MIDRPEIQTVARVFDIAPSALASRSPGRSRTPVAEARFVVFDLLARQGFSRKAIGRMFGFDHSSVCWGLARLNDLCDVYPDYAARVVEARDLLRPDTRAA